MNDTHVWIERIKIRGGNALASQYVINASPMMAINMFAHALQRKIGVRVTSTTVLHHSGSVRGLGEPEFRPSQRIGASWIDKKDYANGRISLSSQPQAELDADISLCLSVQAEADISEEVDEALFGMRIAGGRIESWEMVSTHSDERAAFGHGQSLGGFWVIDRRDLIGHGPDPVTDLIAALGREEPGSWLCATNLGWALLEEPKSRNWVRDGASKHAYCEPLIGVVQYISTHEYEAKELPAWHWRWASSETFIIEQLATKETA